MGLIKALTNAVDTALGDQFKEFVTLPEVGNDVLIVRGNVKHGKGNSNPSEGVITNGSTIVIPQGWAMMLVDNGKVEFSSEPGDYTYDNSSEPSIFYGGLGKGIVDTFKTIGKRFTFGGQTAKDQRVYYINLLEVTGNKFGSSSPKDVYDFSYQMTLKMTFYGTFAYKVDNPLALVQTVIGANPKDKVTFAEVFGEKFKSDVNGHMHEAMVKVLTDKKIPFSTIGGYRSELQSALNGELNEAWNKYGILVTDISVDNIGTTDEYADLIKGAEGGALDARLKGKTYSDNMEGTMAAATAEAMKNAASNKGGAMMGFAGLNMAQNSGSNVLGTVAGMTKGGEETPAPAEGAGVLPNFCPNCGKPTAGTNFCGNCGAKLN